MKNKIALALSLCLTTAVYAQEIEEIVVVGTTTYEAESNPSTDVSLLETLIPEATQAGGYGSFSGYTEKKLMQLFNSRPKVNQQTLESLAQLFNDVKPYQIVSKGCGKEFLDICRRCEGLFEQLAVDVDTVDSGCVHLYYF